MIERIPLILLLVVGLICLLTGCEGAQANTIRFHAPPRCEHGVPVPVRGKLQQCRRVYSQFA